MPSARGSICSASPGSSLALVALALLAAAPARAQLTIEIVGGAGTAIPIAIVPFENESTWPLGITGIVGADLHAQRPLPAGRRRRHLAAAVPRRGRARRATCARAAPTRWSSARCARWATAASTSASRWSTRCKQAQLAAMTYVVTPAQFRATAHKIADVIYEKLTGDAGVFSTRIAYITKQGTRYELHRRRRRRRQSAGDRRLERAAALAARGRRTARGSPTCRSRTRSRSSTCSRSRPAQRQVLANFRGSNSAPAWSPDGRRLAVTLSKDGGSQLFLINADGSGVHAPAHLGRHRHRGVVHAGRPVAAVHVRSRRHAADLPAEPRDQRASSA